MVKIQKITKQVGIIFRFPAKPAVSLVPSCYLMSLFYSTTHRIIYVMSEVIGCSTLIGCFVIWLILDDAEFTVFITVLICFSYSAVCWVVFFLLSLLPYIRNWMNLKSNYQIFFWWYIQLHGEHLYLSTGCKFISPDLCRSSLNKCGFIVM